MSQGHPWEGNWKARLYERVQARGHESLTDFAEAHPTLPLEKLADALGETDVTAVQVFSGLVAEAERNRRVTRLVRGQLVRELAESSPEGWPEVMNEAQRFKIAKALGLWSAYTPETHEKRVEQARATLRATPPPPGWRPLGPDDPLLLTLLPDEET